jgi:cob(I)alamin adenosyltransferase
LENEMDLMDKELLPMKSFILPGGHLAASSLHIARCVCRRAERICVHMQNDGAEVPDLIIKYLNRLSDYLFVLSRYAAHQLKVAEIPWKARL